MKTLSIAVISSIVSATAMFGASLNESNTDSSLIVYNSNIGLVHESRELDIKKNENSIIYRDVASTIDTDSVNISLPKEIKLFSQQYRFDKLSQRKLLDAHIGKRVDIKIMKDAKSFEIKKGILLSSEGGISIVKTDNKDIITIQSKDIIFKNIPKELITKPSLVWNVKVKDNIKSNINLDYLISRIGWRSNYILNIKKDKADLSGWITIQNNSGKSFKDTELHVLAGEINRAREPRINYKIQRDMAMMSDQSPNVAHKAHEGYHFYTIPFKVNLANNEKTQIKFLSQNNLDIKRKYSSTMQNPNHLSGEKKHDVTQYITLKGLDKPLPKGVVRSYSKLKEINILLGESSLKHTPKNSPISLKIGSNFDIKVKETLIQRDDRKWQIESDVSYSITNSSDKKKTVEILIPFKKDKKHSIKSDEKYSFIKGNILSFIVLVEAKSTKQFKANFKTKKSL